ncbi:LSM domain protein [Mammaliicoccus sciuri]|uniref:LSM domain protein n=1 Tax=Mammaliicoccus sciuri TaxID=1296 RepID=UPI0021CE9BC4|nr:LSM domain protein [Mammaliicoccus sciuri]UXU83105.1 LSM domain protein [Mammaliicoccus sciuri]UXU92951.1 LSM domain protein [Mammaliicoccus sciuri]UXV14853.1 LSM domain protein [Mammaliicoccus sciuri]UXV23165.1 LSM domain protein [Mammaliicoccus sciuri]UXV25895.1 LSM domain protein [Mammaliicoccus sciuri]
MKLWTYIGKKVRIELTNGNQFIGEVTNYDDEVVNDSGEPSIHFATESYLYDFDESEIKSIEILG